MNGSIAAETQTVLQFANAYSSMTFSIQGTKDGQPRDLTLSYSLVYATSTSYKVNFVYVNNTVTTDATMWATKGGTVLALYANGRNYTNGQAVTNYLANLMAPIATYYGFGAELATSSAYFHSTGSSSMTVGGNSFGVTNYTANSPNVAIPSCNGDSYYLTTYDMSVGTPSGTTFVIIPYMELVGTETTSGGSASISYVIQITAFTVG